METCVLALDGAEIAFHGPGYAACSFSLCFSLINK